MNNLIKIIRNNDINYKNKIESLLNLEGISQRTKVEFALYCAKQSFKYIDAIKYPDLYVKTSKVLELVGDWILGKKVYDKDLNNAANAAAYAANAAYATANAAAYAANAAAYAAAYAANATANAAANAAAYAAAYDKEIKKLYNYALTLVIKELNIDNIFKVLYGNN